MLFKWYYTQNHTVVQMKRFILYTLHSEAPGPSWTSGFYEKEAKNVGGGWGGRWKSTKQGEWEKEMEKWALFPLEKADNEIDKTGPEAPYFYIGTST